MNNYLADQTKRAYIATNQLISDYLTYGFFPLYSSYNLWAHHERMYCRANIPGIRYMNNNCKSKSSYNTINTKVLISTIRTIQCNPHEG